MKTTVSTCLGKLLPSEEILIPFVFFFDIFQGGRSAGCVGKKNRHHPAAVRQWGEKTVRNSSDQSAHQSLIVSPDSSGVLLFLLPAISIFLDEVTFSSSTSRFVLFPPQQRHQE